MPFVSIIIPVYNTLPGLLERAVASVDKQRAEKEVIVIDDGSDPALAEAYAEVIVRYMSARLVRKPNGGVSSARNVGLAEARGEWIGFLDADDVLTPEYLPEALDILARSGADAVHGGYYYEYASGARDFHGQDGLAPGEYVLLQGDDLEYLKGSLFDGGPLAPLGFARTNYCSSCCALFRKERAATLRFDESVTISEDRLFNYNFWSRAGSVALGGGIWYRYMENSESASHRLRPRAREEPSAHGLRLRDPRERRLAMGMRACVEGHRGMLSADTLVYRPAPWLQGRHGMLGCRVRARPHGRACLPSGLRRTRTQGCQDPSHEDPLSTSHGRSHGHLLPREWSVL